MVQKPFHHLFTSASLCFLFSQCRALRQCKAVVEPSPIPSNVRAADKATDCRDPLLGDLRLLVSGLLNASLMHSRFGCVYSMQVDPISSCGSLTSYMRSEVHSLLNERLAASKSSSLGYNMQTTLHHSLFAHVEPLDVLHCTQALPLNLYSNVQLSDVDLCLPAYLSLS